MANDLNLCQFIGRLGQDPEAKYTAAGTAVTKISIAVGEQWRDKSSGEKQERTTWVNVVAFGKLAEIMAQYLSRGARVYLSGKLSVRQYEKDGQRHYVTEIVAKDMQMLDSKAERSTSAAQPETDYYGDSDAGDSIPF